MVVVAYQIWDSMTDGALGIGIPEMTCLVIDQNGTAQVMGSTRSKGWAKATHCFCYLM